VKQHGQIVKLLIHLNATLIARRACILGSCN